MHTLILSYYVMKIFANNFKSKIKIHTKKSMDMRKIYLWEQKLDLLQKACFYIMWIRHRCSSTTCISTKIFYPTTTTVIIAPPLMLLSGLDSECVIDRSHTVFMPKTRCPESKIYGITCHADCRVKDLRLPLMFLTFTVGSSIIKRENPCTVIWQSASW